MKERIILSEIFRMSELMGINSKDVNKRRMIKEAVLSGGGIIDDFIEALIKKTPDDITALGFRNADEIKQLADNFPTAPVDEQAIIIRDILENASEMALKNIAKEIVDDISTVVGTQVKTIIDDYTELIAKYPNITADEWAEKLSKDLGEKFKGSQVPELTDQVTKEAVDRIRTAKGAANNTPVGPTKAEIEEILKMENELKKAQDIEGMIATFKNSNDWNKISYIQRQKFMKFVRKHNAPTIDGIQRAADLDFQKRVIDAGLSKARREALTSKFTTLPWYGKIILLAIVAGVVGFPLGKWAGWFAGKGWTQTDLDEIKKGFKEGSEETPEEPEVNTGACPKEAGFVTAIQAVYTGNDGMPAYDATKMTFDENTCSGTYDGVTYKWENNDWKQK